MELTLWLRVVNCLLGGLVAGLCFLKLDTKNPDAARNSRIAGLGIICVAISLGSFSNRNDEFNVRIPMITAGLLFSYYGMRRMASGERPRF